MPCPGDPVSTNLMLQQILAPAPVKEAAVWSISPDEIEPIRIEPVEAASAWTDADVVEHGGDDRVPPIHTQLGPRLSE